MASLSLPGLAPELQCWLWEGEEGEAPSSEPLCTAALSLGSLGSLGLGRLASSLSLTVLHAGFHLAPLPERFVLRLKSSRHRLGARISSSFTSLYHIHGDSAAGEMVIEPWRTADRAWLHWLPARELGSNMEQPTVVDSALQEERP